METTEGAKKKNMCEKKKKKEEGAIQLVLKGEEGKNRDLSARDKRPEEKKKGKVKSLNVSSHKKKRKGGDIPPLRRGRGAK